VGEVVQGRFPGAEVDYDFLDAWAWSPELLRHYAARARNLAARYGSQSPRGQLPAWPRGRCQDCRKAVRLRLRLGRRLLCEPCAEPRLRVRHGLAEATAGPPYVGKAWREA
jgi:hypothetical protein